jgi:dihydrolipoamide dehydrogenase
MPDFDLTVVGSGPGGYVAAIHAARQGAKVAIVEERDWGGTCLNWGCIPTKALIQGVEVLAMARRAAEFGVTIPSAEPDWPVMQARKDKVVAGMRNGVQSLLKSNGVELVPGRGRLSGDVKVAVDGRDLGATNILLAPGSVPARPPIPGIEHGLTSDDLLGIKQIPSSLVIVGGGVVGMEFAGIFNTLGTRVTVIEMLDQVLTPLDPDLANRFQQLMTRRGIEFNLSSRVEGIEKGDSGFRVGFEGRQVEADLVLVATGRVPATDDMGIDEAGIVRERGAVKVDGHLRTNVPNVFAIGDATMISMLAHTASYQGEVAVANALGKKITADYRAIPACVYTDPEIAFVGLSEAQARAAGETVKVGTFPFSALGRAQVLGETAGMVKLVTDGDGYLLGGTIMGPRATDLIAEIALAVSQGLTAAELAHTVHAHPTLPEAIFEAALDVDGLAVHIAPRKP